MKKVFLAAAAVLLIAGCQSLRTANFSDEQAIPLEEGRTDSLLISISLDYPVKGAPQEVLDRMTAGILGAAFDLEDGPSETVEETATRYEDNIKDEYFNEYEQTEGKGDILSWEDRINGYISGKWSHYKTYMIEYYGFRGGAHGINTMTPVVFDVKTGETVPEEAFFAAGFRTPVAALIQARLRRSARRRPARRRPACRRPWTMTRKPSARSSSPTSSARTASMKSPGTASPGTGSLMTSPLTTWA